MPKVFKQIKKQKKQKSTSRTLVSDTEPSKTDSGSEYELLQEWPPKDQPFTLKSRRQDSLDIYRFT
jgi:hypothetical protein